MRQQGGSGTIPTRPTGVILTRLFTLKILRTCKSESQLSTPLRTKEKLGMRNPFLAQLRQQIGFYFLLPDNILELHTTCTFILVESISLQTQDEEEAVIHSVIRGSMGSIDAGKQFESIPISSNRNL